MAKEAGAGSGNRRHSDPATQRPGTFCYFLWGRLESTVGEHVPQKGEPTTGPLTAVFRLSTRGPGLNTTPGFAVHKMENTEGPGRITWGDGRERRGEAQLRLDSQAST